MKKKLKDLTEHEFNTLQKMGFLYQFFPDAPKFYCELHPIYGKNKKAKLKKYKFWLCPNNQPRILVGEYLATNKELVLEIICKKERIKLDDENIWIEEVKRS